MDTFFIGWCSWSADFSALTGRLLGDIAVGVWIQRLGRLVLTGSWKTAFSA